MNTQQATPNQRHTVFQFAPPMMAGGFASIGKVRTQLFGLSTSAFYRLRRDNADFPKQVDLGIGRKPMFDVSECLAWIEKRKRTGASITTQSKEHAAKRGKART